MKWAKVADADEWVLLYPDRGEVARVRRVSPNEHILITLTGLIEWHPTLAEAKREAERAWLRAERRYGSARHVMGSQR